MKVYWNIKNFSNVKFPVVTTGTFDGVHLGHQKIIKRLKEIAHKEAGESVILTFNPHPRMVLFPDDNELKLLNTPEEKITLLEKAGIDHLIIHPFTKDFSRLSSIEFVRDMLVNKIGTKRLVIGYNHHFGRNREGSFEHLKECGPLYGFNVEEITAKDIENVEVSSTKIRSALLKGNIKTANKYLGYSYFISGTVVKGKQIGRTIGYPTANLHIGDKFKLIPSNGVYAVTIKIQGDLHKGMLNIGMNPTVSGTQRTIEVNLFDFDQEIYDKKITVFLHEKIREEKKFEGLEQLKSQLHEDKKKSLHLLNN